MMMTRQVITILATHFALILLCLFLIPNRIEAQKLNVSVDTELKIQVYEDNSASYHWKFTLTNLDSSQLVGKFSLPVNEIGNVVALSASLNGNVISSTKSGNNIVVDFGPGAVKSGVPGLIAIQYTTTGALKKQYTSHILLDWPANNFNEKSRLIEVAYPAKFGDNIFAPHGEIVSSQNKVIFRNKLLETYSVEWIPSHDLEVSFSFDLTNEGIRVIPLISPQLGYSLIYPDLDSKALMGSDIWDNHYLFASRKPEYKLQVRRNALSDSFVPRPSGCQKIPLPASLERTEAALADLVLALKRLPIDGSAAPKLTTLNDLTNKLGEGKELNLLEATCVASSWAGSLGLLDNGISYGYYLLDSARDKSFEKPAIWLEILKDKELILIDMARINSDNFFYQVQDSSTLRFGYWETSLQHINFWGMNTEFSQLRPHFQLLEEFNTTPNSWEIFMHKIPELYAGEFWQVDFVIENKSQVPVNISQVLLDQEDYSAKMLQLAPGFRRLISPNGEVNLTIPYLREANFLFEGKQAHSLVIRSSYPQLDPYRLDFQVSLKPDTRIPLIAASIIVLAGVTAIVWWVYRATEEFRFVRRQVRRVNKKLTPEKVVQPVPVLHPQRQDQRHIKVKDHFEES